MIQPTILMEPGSPADVWTLTGTTVDLDRGDLLSFEDGVAVLMNLVTEDATFAGVCHNAYDADILVPAQVTSLMKCIIDIDVTSATYTGFQPLLWASDNCLETDAGANTIAFCWRAAASAVTRLKVYVNVPELQKLFAVSA